MPIKSPAVFDLPQLLTPKCMRLHCRASPIYEPDRGACCQHYCKKRHDTSLAYFAPKNKNQIVFMIQPSYAHDKFELYGSWHPFSMQQLCSINQATDRLVQIFQIQHTSDEQIGVLEDFQLKFEIYVWKM